MKTSQIKNTVPNRDKYVFKYKIENIDIICFERLVSSGIKNKKLFTSEIEQMV